MPEVAATRCARQEVHSKPRQLRHQAVDDDGDGHRGEHESAQDRVEAVEPVADREVQDGQCWEDGDPDHHRELVLRHFLEPES